LAPAAFPAPGVWIGPSTQGKDIITYRMPAEWEPHERTIFGWPCRLTAWGDRLAQGRAEVAALANAIAAFEPVTMVCASAADAAIGNRTLLQPGFS
jgi:agmatine deiminase